MVSLVPIRTAHIRSDGSRGALVYVGPLPRALGRKNGSATSRLSPPPPPPLDEAPSPPALGRPPRPCSFLLEGWRHLICICTRHTLLPSPPNRLLAARIDTRACGLPHPSPASSTAGPPPLRCIEGDCAGGVRVQTLTQRIVPLLPFYKVR